MSIKLAQTFYIDRAIVKNAEHVRLDSLDLFFKAKPLSTKNRSGITNPGVTIYIAPITNDGIPDLDNIFETGLARREYNEIISSLDASINTKFTFKHPLILETNQTYGLVVAFDGNEEYDLWRCREGEFLVGTNTITSGANAKNVIKHWEYHFDELLVWKPLSNVDLKFSLYACAWNSNTDAANTSDTYILPSDPTEYIIYHRYHPKTLNRTSLKVGELVFKETPVIYGTISVNNQSVYVTSTNNINFSTIFPVPAVTQDDVLSYDPVLVDEQYIVLRNGSTQAANVDVVKVLSVLSNTEIQLERLPNFTNNTATFSVTGVGILDHHDTHFHTGRWFDYTANAFTYQTTLKTDMIRLVKSNANSTVRFSNNNLDSLSVISGGTGYSNSDVITIYPILDGNTANSQHIAYIPEYANAVANVVTNGTGVITGISVTNAGFGMSSNVTFAITTANGTGATMNVVIGSTLRGAESNATLGDCYASSIPVNRTYPNIRVQQNQNHTVEVVQHFPFHVFPGFEHLVDQANTALNTQVSFYRNHHIVDLVDNDSRIHVLPSHSIIRRGFANVTLQFANGTIHSSKFIRSSVIELPVSSNNAYTMPTVSHGQVYNYSYVINNDITGETKGHGNAMCRHISEKVTFNDNQNAEDLVVFCNLYRPAGTNLYAYARILASDDQDAFDDKDWTLLQLTSNNASYISSGTNEDDLVQFTFNIPSAPASVNTIAGDVNTTLNSANLVGLNSAWNTDLQVNDVVKVYSKLFPEDYMISVVRSIANSTFLTLDDPVATTSIAGGTCSIDLIGRPTNGTNPEIGNPFQAFIYGPDASIVRYYDSTMSKHDTFHSFQIKLVLTSNNSSIVPKVWNTSAVGVSA